MRPTNGITFRFNEDTSAGTFRVYRAGIMRFGVHIWAFTPTIWRARNSYKEVHEGPRDRVIAWAAAEASAAAARLRLQSPVPPPDEDTSTDMPTPTGR